MSEQIQTEQTVETHGSTEPIQVGSYTGQVKAFNPRKGYGFIAVHGENTDDVFVHQTNICPVRSTYRTLTRGEYVSFDISDDDKRQALNVRGVGGGTLRCDAVGQRRPRGNTSSTDGGDNSDEGFTTVNRRQRSNGQGRSGGRGRGRGGGRGGRGGRGGPRQPRVQNANGDAPSSATIADFIPADAEVAVDSTEATSE